MNIRITPGLRRPSTYPWDDEILSELAASDLLHVDRTFGVLGIGNPSHLTADLHEELARTSHVNPSELLAGGELELRPYHERRAIVDTVWQWLRGFSVIEEGETELLREIPLAVFNCPDRPQAKTSFAESTATGATVGWSIDVFGTGSGSDMSLTVTQTNTFNAAPAERKLIFAPLRMRVVSVALCKGGVIRDRFLRAEAADSAVRDANGVRSASAAEWATFVEASRPVEYFNLSADTGSASTSYERAYELSGTFETKLGLEAFHLKSTISAKCTAKQTVTMKFELPPGQQYELRKPTEVAGFYFP